MTKKPGKFILLAVLVAILPLTVSAWGQQRPDEIPDAPSAARPVPPPESPSAKPAPENPTPEAAPSGLPTTPPDEPPHSANPADNIPASPSDATTAPPPMPPVKTVPEGSVPRDLETRADLYTVTSTVNFVLVPVTVKDPNGRAVDGLLPKDFSVLENGQKQPLKFFTSDPFPLSAAVIFDLGMPDIAVKKVQESLPALEGAFSAYDQVAIYTYSSTVSRVSDFNGVGQQLTAVLNQIKTYTGANNGVPVTNGPLGPQGPIINGRPIDQPINPVVTPPKQYHVLNDAILAAARDLSKQDRTRRKIIFVVSDGRELGSRASYADTLKVLLTQNVIVYAVAVENSAIPVYGTLQRVHLPKMGYSNILPKYVSATGGGAVYSEYAANDIERAYLRAIGDARNQYTLGYSSKPGIGGYRQIEVRVRRPDVKVYAKDGYYPLPAAR